MPCKSCEERRAIIAAAKSKGGAVEVVRKLPAVAVHLVRYPPIVRKPKG